MTFDRQAFLERVLEFRRHGAEELLANGPLPDPILKQELLRPGSDARLGVNLVCRPPPPIAREISRLQARLRRLEPRQHYYSESDLHLTLVEICHGRAEAEVLDIASRLSPEIGGVLAGLPVPSIEAPILAFDRAGCALNFLPLDGRLQHLRAAIYARLRAISIEPAARYPPTSAHVSLMRYVEELDSPLAKWLRLLGELPISEPLHWRLETIHLTWGATWYGMRTRVETSPGFSLVPDVGRVVTSPL